jgi:hypothetical protein
LQKLKRRRNTKTIAETEQKYQIAEADTKLQKLKRRRNTKTMAETDRNTKLQKLKDSRNTRFCRSERQNITPNFIFFFLQKLNANTKLQKLKRRRNTKTIAEIEQKYQIAEVEGKSKY